MSDFDLIDASTGQPVRVSADEAEAGLREGRLRAGRALRAVAPTGVAGSLEPGGIARALQRGYRLETPEMAARRAEQQAHPIQTQVVEPAVTAAAHVLRGPTLGTSRVLEHGLGELAGEPELYERLSQENPTAASVGDVAGIAASVPEGGGAGILAPAEAAGARVAGAIAPAGASAARSVLGAAAGTATEAALQGAAMEGGEILTEQALGEDSGDIAERMIASGGLAAVLGGGLGASGRLLREGTRAGAGRARDMAALLSRTFEQRTGQALDGRVAEAMAERLAGAASIASGHPREAIAAMTAPGAERIVLRGQEAMEEGSRRLAHHMDRAERAYERVADGITGTGKASSVERLMSGDIGVQIQHAEEQIAASRRLADEMDQQIRAYGGASAFGQRGGLAMRRIRGAVERAEDRIAAIRRGTSRADQAEAFVTLDELRRQMGHAVSDLRVGNEGPVWDRFMSLRSGLEDASIWGADAAALQRETNAAWHPLITANEPFRSHFLGNAGLAEGFERLPEADSARVRSYISGLGTAASDTAETIWQRRYDAMEALNNAALARHGLSAGERQAALSLRAELRELRAAHAEIAGDATRLRQWNEISGNQAGSIGGIIGAGAIGAGMPGIGLPLMVASQLANPARSIRILQTIRRMSRQMDTRILSSVRGFLGRGARRAAEYGATGVTRARRGAVRGVAAYAARIAELDRHSDPQQLSRAVGDATAAMTRPAPRTQSAIASTAARAVTYLQAQRPRGRVLAGDLRHEQRPPSTEEMDRFLRVARAVDDPASVLDDLRARRLTPDAVRALREVYPALYRRMVTTVMQELANTENHPSYQDRLQLGILLGIPTDPALTPQSLAILQQAHEMASAQQPPPPARGQRMELAGRYASASDRTEQRRQPA